MDNKYLSLPGQAHKSIPVQTLNVSEISNNINIFSGIHRPMCDKILVQK